MRQTSTHGHVSHATLLVGEMAIGVVERGQLFVASVARADNERVHGDEVLGEQRRHGRAARADARWLPAAWTMEGESVPRQ